MTAEERACPFCGGFVEYQGELDFDPCSKDDSWAVQCSECDREWITCIPPEVKA